MELTTLTDPNLKVKELQIICNKYQIKTSISWKKADYRKAVDNFAAEIKATQTKIELINRYLIYFMFLLQ